MCYNYDININIFLNEHPSQTFNVRHEKGYLCVHLQL